VQPAPAPHPLGPNWPTEGFRQLGWRLIPLRGFLAVTFLYASLQKLANPNYLHASSPGSFVAQSRALESTSPIAPLLRWSLHAPTLFALLIALGELAVALGLLFGLWTRVAAIGGMLLSLTFFLTVSWSTTPYFYGSDIVFVFAWSVFAACGAAEVLSLDAWIDARLAGGRRRPRNTVNAVRRRMLIAAPSTVLLAGVAALVGGSTALIGRAVGGTRHAGSGFLSLSASHASPPATTAPTPSSRPARRRRGSRGSKPKGVALAPLGAVPVGQGRRFTDPATGRPGWVLRPNAATVRAFSAVCTHAGCVVAFDASSMEFVCPCHGGRFSARSGAVVGGPPPTPLSQIPVHIANGEIRAD
jgi:thiosulfate dehydrogenase [quinone] large subunit